MKIFCRFIYIAIYLVFLLYVLILPSNNIHLKLYTGKRINTITEITLIPLNVKININRLPFDSLWLSPLTLFPYINVGFIIEELESYPKVPYMESIDSNTLGYCYLLALQASEMELFTNQTYNVTEYFDKDFSLSDLKLMSKEDLESFLKELSSKAKSNIENIQRPVVNSIAETTNEKYLFIYAVRDDIFYVLDPEYPQNLNNYIKNNKYSIYMDTYDIKNYYKIKGGIG